MTDYEYIFKKTKLCHYKGWDDTELRKCVDMLPNLSREELMALYTSRWIKDCKTLKQEIFKIMYLDRLGEREERFKEMSTNELINEFEERSSGNVSLIRQELKHRYKDGFDEDRIKIAAAFSNSTKGDQNWIELQKRREMSGGRKMSFPQFVDK